MALCNDLAGPLFCTAFFPVQPAATALISYFTLGATLTVDDLVGAAIVSVGLLIVVASKSSESSKALQLADSDDDDDGGTPAESGVASPRLEFVAVVTKKR